MAKKKAHDLTAIIDTREQRSLNLEKYGLKTVREKLDYGDYSLKYPNLKQIVSIERKNIDDFVMCCGKERDRFKRELAALKGFRYKLILCEFPYSAINKQQYRSKIKPQCVTASIARWTVEGIPFIHVENPDEASKFVADFLRFVANEIISYAAYACKKK